MKLWNKLYNTVWLAFFCCMLIPHWIGDRVGPPVHAVLGVIMLIVATTNARHLAALPVPARLKRISKTTAGIATFQLLCGVAVGAVAHLAPDVPMLGSVLRIAHVVCALAILAQASSVATAYDMWEEKELGT